MSTLEWVLASRQGYTWCGSDTSMCRSAQNSLLPFKGEQILILLPYFLVYLKCRCVLKYSQRYCLPFRSLLWKLYFFLINQSWDWPSWLLKGTYSKSYSKSYTAVCERSLLQNYTKRDCSITVKLSECKATFLCELQSSFVVVLKFCNET